MTQKILVEKGIRAMNVALIFIIAGALAVCPVVYAQSMIEYSTLATRSTTASNAIAATSHAIEKKAANLNTALSQDASKESPSGEKSAIAQNQPVVAGPTPPAVFILFNGERLETNHYLLTNNSLRVQQGGAQRTIPLSTINMDATVAANHERGIDLRIPKSKSEIMLSF